MRHLSLFTPSPTPIDIVVHQLTGTFKKFKNVQLE